jgi:hypothetical protein
MEVETVSRYQTAHQSEGDSEEDTTTIILHQYSDPSTSTLSTVPPRRQRLATGIPPKRYTEGSPQPAAGVEKRLKHALIVVGAIAIVLFITVVVLLWQFVLSNQFRHF